MAGAALPSDDDLFGLFGELRGAGYRLTPAQLEAALAILRLTRAGEMAGPPPPSPERLASLLTPILATSPGEQADLHGRIVRWRGPDRRGRIDPAATAAATLPLEIRRGWLWPVVAAAVGALALVLAVVYALQPGPERPAPVPIERPRSLDNSLPPTRTETITTVFLIPDPLQPVRRWGLILAPVTVFGGWIALRWLWRRQWRAWRCREEQSDLLDLGHRTAGTTLFDDAALSATAQQWQRFQRVPTRDLDIERTVAATVDRAGLFTPVYRTRPVSPDYVVLVEEHSRHDHLARLADCALDRLVAEGVAIERYTCADGITHLRPSGAWGPVRPLADLDALASQRSLVIIGSGAGLFEPLTARLGRQTADALDGWRHRAFLSTRPVAAWGERELALLDRGIALGTARRSGLHALGDHVASGHPEHGRLLEGVLLDRGAPLPATAGVIPDSILFRDIDAPWCPEMVVIPAGTFLMGSPDDEPDRKTNEGPRHAVTVGRFALGRYAVTFEEYDHFCEETGKAVPSDQGWGRGRRPAINVRWDDARAYCEWLSARTKWSYRLPSESEWEYACRAGTTGPFHTGPTITTALANFDGNFTYNGSSTGEYREKTVEVGGFPANGFGLHEMHGNVWEWVEDCWHDSYQGAPGDGTAWTTEACKSRVLRGGSWDNLPIGLRSANRLRNPPDNRDVNIGFRVARTITS